MENTENVNLSGYIRIYYIRVVCVCVCVLHYDIFSLFCTGTYINNIMCYDERESLTKTKYSKMASLFSGFETNRMTVEQISMMTEIQKE